MWGQLSSSHHLVFEDCCTAATAVAGLTTCIILSEAQMISLLITYHVIYDPHHFAIGASVMYAS